MRSRLIFLILLLAIGCFCGAATGEDVAVVAHKNVPESNLSSSRLLDFYTGDIKSWSNGDPVVVFDLKEKGPTRDSFYSWLGKSPTRMKSIWMKKLLSGEGDPPEALDTEEEIVERVATTPGAVGFVRISLASEQVTTLNIIKDSQAE